MKASAFTVGFRGLECALAEVHCDIGAGLPKISFAGADRHETERQKSSLVQACGSIGLALPPKQIAFRIECSSAAAWTSSMHFAVMAAFFGAMGIADMEMVSEMIFFGEFDDAGQARGTPGLLSGSLLANDRGMAVVCSADQLDISCEIPDLCVAPLSGPPGLASFLKTGSPIPRQFDEAALERLRSGQSQSSRLASGLSETQTGLYALEREILEQLRKRRTT